MKQGMTLFLLMFFGYLNLLSLRGYGMQGGTPRWLPRYRSTAAS